MVIYAVFPKYPPLFSAVAAAYEKPRWPLPDNSGEKQQKARRKAVREGGLLHRVVQIPPSPIFSLDKYPHRVYTEPIKHGRTLPMSCCETGKTKDRSQAEVRRLMNRLSRVEGQIRGLKEMLQSDAYCIDILVQVSAATAALNSFSKELLGTHIKTCVAENIRQGNDEVVDELVCVLQRLMR